MIKIQEHQLFPVEKIVIGRSYQRSIELRRLDRISRSVHQSGYFPWSVVILNQDFYVIDGQHRVKAAIENGVKQIPVSVVHCQDEKEEAEVFSSINSFNTRLSPSEFWHARNIIGNPYAKLLYALHDSPSSKLYYRIAIKDHKSDKTKFALSTVTMMLNVFAFDVNYHWTLNDDDELTKLAAKVDPLACIDNVNRFVQFFFDCFGEQKADNPIAYLDVSLRSFILFYKRLITGETKSVLASSRDYIRATAKMNSFVFTQDWRRIGQSARINMLINHWNKGRKTLLLSYDEKSLDKSS